MKAARACFHCRGGGVGFPVLGFTLSGRGVPFQNKIEERRRGKSSVKIGLHHNVHMNPTLRRSTPIF